MRAGTSTSFSKRSICDCGPMGRTVNRKFDSGISNLA
jgi:hypothetical protein